MQGLFLEHSASRLAEQRCGLRRQRHRVLLDVVFLSKQCWSANNGVFLAGIVIEGGGRVVFVPSILTCLAYHWSHAASRKSILSVGACRALVGAGSLVCPVPSSPHTIAPIAPSHLTKPPSFSGGSGSATDRQPSSPSSWSLFLHAVVASECVATANVGACQHDCIVERFVLAPRPHPYLRPFVPSYPRRYPRHWRIAGLVAPSFRRLVEDLVFSLHHQQQRAISLLLAAR